jgi:hypothetical protein
MNERSGGFDNKRADAAHTHREGNQMTDWEHIRATKTSNEHPDDWPKGVRAISQRGLGLFGIKESTGQLYWDGAQVKTRNLLSLGTPERWIASVAAVGAFGTFLVNLIRFVSGH